MIQNYLFINFILHNIMHIQYLFSYAFIVEEPYFIMETWNNRLIVIITIIIIIIIIIIYKKR